MTKGGRDGPEKRGGEGGGREGGEPISTIISPHHPSSNPSVTQLLSQTNSIHLIRLIRRKSILFWEEGGDFSNTFFFSIFGAYRGAGH